MYCLPEVRALLTRGCVVPARVWHGMMGLEESGALPHPCPRAGVPHPLVSSCWAPRLHWRGAVLSSI